MFVVRSVSGSITMLLCLHNCRLDFVMKKKQRIENAIEMIVDMGQYDGSHHKQWVLDQVLRILTDCPTEIIEAVDSKNVTYVYNSLGTNKKYEHEISGIDWDVGVPP